MLMLSFWYKFLVSKKEIYVRKLQKEKGLVSIHIKFGNS